jgi:hypothetical protein
MMPYFKNCIGALDGTHISATPHSEDLIIYIGRGGIPTQNVLAIVDFNMRFIYASTGQPGSTHDTNVLFHALRHDHDTFPHPPQGMLQINNIIHMFVHEFISLHNINRV